MTKLELKQRAALVDEYGQLAAELAPLEAEAQAELARRLQQLQEKQQRRAALEAQIRAFGDNADAAAPLQMEGKRFLAILSARGNQTSIPDMPAVETALGREQFLKLCTVTLKDLKENLTASQVIALTTQQRTGPRKLSVIPKATAKAA